MILIWAWPITSQNLPSGTEETRV